MSTTNNRTDEDRIAAFEAMRSRATDEAITPGMHAAIDEFCRLHRGAVVPEGRIPLAGSFVTPATWKSLFPNHGAGREKKNADRGSFSVPDAEQPGRPAQETRASGPYLTRALSST